MVPQPASQMCRERAAFPLLNFGRVSLIQVCLRTRHARHYAIIGEICDNWQAPVVGVKQHDMFAAAGSGQRAAGSRQRSPRVIYATWTLQVGYFLTMRRGADGVGAAGEITNVTHVFQPSGRFSAANSL